MKKIKELFSTPKRIAISVACIIGIVGVLTMGSIFIAQAFAENTAIGADNAKNFAFADAEVDPASAKNVTVQFEFEQGQFVYEVEFDADGTEYEYWIKASDGSVVKKQQEIVTSNGTNVKVSARITLDAAKETALKDAGVTASEVTFTSEKLDVDDNTTVYDIEFHTKDTEYEYEINADSGAIYSKSKEPYTPRPTTQPAATAIPAGSQATAKPALQPTAAPETRPQATTQPQQPSSGSTGNSGQTGNTGSTGSSGSGNSSQSGATDSSGQTGTGQISVDAAKSKALADAGLSASQVTFTKARLDHDDRYAVYDIEFYTSSAEYEYEIGASDGAVYDRSIEYFEHHQSSTGSGSTGSSGQTGSTGNSGSGNSSQSGSTGSSISLDQAKSIAADHAGFSASDVNFSKAKLDHDDGHTVYEIEFYRDGVEYEYKIDASTGAIIDYDAEHDD